MRICPFCHAQNREDATVCYNCGSLLFDNVAEDADPTQQTKLANPYGQPYGQSAYQGQPSYSNKTADWQTAYPPPSPAVQRRPTWPLLIVGLSLLLAFACGLAIFTLILTTRNGVGGLGAQVATQMGQVFGGAGSDNPAPDGSAPNSTPTPWPTFTPTPIHSAQGSVTPNPTQASITDKLLSAQCKGALNQLSAVSDQVKNDPLKVLDDTWRKNVDLAVANMKTFCGSLDSASPIPGKIGQVQKSMDQATSEFDQAKLLWTQAIDQRDPSKAVSAAQHVGEATKYLGLAISQLQQIVP
jgi:hypothetical protein